MKTRKAVIALHDGTTVEATDLDDETWREFLRLNESWQAGRTGGIDFNYGTDGARRTFQFEWADIERIDLWPGSEEPW